MKKYDAEIIRKVKEAKSVPELMTLAKANGIKNNRRRGKYLF